MGLGGHKRLNQHSKYYKEPPSLPSYLQLCSAYQLVRIREEWKTTFNTSRGHNEYLVMPLRLTNASATFQNMVTTSQETRRIHLCMRTWIIFSKTKVEHNQAVSGSVVLLHLSSEGLPCLTLPVPPAAHYLIREHARLIWSMFLCSMKTFKKLLMNNSESTYYFLFT